MRKLVLLVSVLTALIGASVAMGLGGGSSSGIRRTGNPVIQEHRVAAPSGKAATLAAGSRRAKVIYFETNVFKLPSGATDGATGRCPRRAQSINGYFGSNTNQVTAIHDAVANSVRKWGTFLHNFGADARVWVGTVCLKP